MRCLKGREKVSWESGRGAVLLSFWEAKKIEEEHWNKTSSALQFLPLVCAPPCTDANLADKMNTPTKDSQNKMVIYQLLRSKTSTHPHMQHTYLTESPLGSGGLDIKQRRRYLRRGLNGWFIQAEAVIWGPNQIVVDTLYASVQSHPHQNGHLSFREPL